MSSFVENRVAVAVLGPPDSIRDLLDLTPEFPGMEPVPCPYEDEQDALAVYRRVPDHCRAILFTGPLPYLRVVEKVAPAVPVTYVPFDDVALYRTLFHARDRHDISRASVDTVPRGRVVDTYQDLGLKASRLYVLEYGAAISRSDFVTFHRQHLEAGRATVALTCLRTAHLELQALGLPCERVVAPRSVLLQSLEKAYLLAQNLRVSENQTVVGILDISEALASARQGRTEHELQRLRLQVQAELMEHVARLDGYLTPAGYDEFLFFTTQGPLLRLTRGLTEAPLLGGLQALPSQAAYLGVGMGATAAEAGEHARLALASARRSGQGTCFVVLEDRRVVGPLGAQPVPLVTRTVNTDLQRMAEGAGVSAVTLERVVQTAQGLSKATFTAHDLAQKLLITQRSARRLCRVLEGAGLIEETGAEAPAPRGRPRTVFQLTAAVRQPGVGGEPQWP